MRRSVEMSELEEKINNKDRMNFKISNVVATANFETLKKLDLIQIAQKLKDTEYNPERFPGLILRLYNPKVTFLIFSTGKTVLTGLKTVDSANKAVKKIVKIFKKNGIKLSNPEVSIRNLVANGDLNTLIDLDKAALMLDYAMYEPEVFPGLIYRNVEKKAVFLIFSTGKYVCVGTKSEEVIGKAIIELLKVINEHNLAKDNVIEDNYDELIFI